MAKEKKIYYKLGSKASTFVDPKAGIKLVNKDVVEVSASKAKSSKTVTAAIEGGHIREATEEEYQAFLASKNTRKVKDSKVPKKEEVKEEEEEDQDAEEEDQEEDDEEEETPAQKKARIKAEKKAAKGK